MKILINFPFKTTFEKNTHGPTAILDIKILKVDLN